MPDTGDINILTNFYLRPPELLLGDGLDAPPEGAGALLRLGLGLLNDGALLLGAGLTDGVERLGCD